MMSDGPVTRKLLGKINSITLGFDSEGDYGVIADLSFDGLGTTWRWTVPEKWEPKRWTAEEHSDEFVNINRFIFALIKAAKVSDFSQLKGKPIEVSLDHNLVRHWRILEEVL